LTLCFFSFCHCENRDSSPVIASPRPLSMGGTKQSHLLSFISGITSSFGFSQEQMGLLRPPSAVSQWQKE